MYNIEYYYKAQSVFDAVRRLSESADARLIAGGCAMLMIALVLMLPAILASAFLLATCFAGDCL